ncbi:hypothetical protein Moror_17131 [Moniliophthora roreri MCA 2997]|uniref:SH3 domain-containing protein n=1 Tax=Moniliophthora roreri (strain MCA 2997) TaxID=1381753 RepID=V2X4Q8_MONRO|nr:hypothetical protein Moror_17131 [Moniliophthora roreri MCA 2997]KAI3604514.1 hypothetical protein WG66_008597 [Moniliophthora roreri]
MTAINASALLDHIISQTKANVDFLVAQNHISPETGREILSRLPKASDPASNLVDSTRNLNIRSSPPTSSYVPPSGPPPPPFSNPNPVRAKALWGYNEDGNDPNDLSFQAGDIIEVVAETNQDWWTGRHNGREGLFPSNYVEKLPPTSLPPKPSPRPYEKMNSPAPPGPPTHAPMPHYAPPPGPPGGYAPRYNPPGGYQGPPPPHPVYTPYSAVPPPAPASAPPAPVAAAEPQKESKFGSLGNTLGHAAAGGVGFGAGSAIGSGIVNSIF